ncbi:hypothetical protein TWF481_009145 [Arthrobotrys musiformis]|uniref:Uncharacterized protein n=1 Tax=Arthrobotrys musiformis TaxID=47236 RepID=A0AAV9W3V0_9PEZI
MEENQRRGVGRRIMRTFAGGAEGEDHEHTRGGGGEGGKAIRQGRPKKRTSQKAQGEGPETNLLVPPPPAESSKALPSRGFQRTSSTSQAPPGGPAARQMPKSQALHSQTPPRPVTAKQAVTTTTIHPTGFKKHT